MNATMKMNWSVLQVLMTLEHKLKSQEPTGFLIQFICTRISEDTGACWNPLDANAFMAFDKVCRRASDVLGSM